MANLKDFATGTVLTAPTPATSGPSVTLQSGEGALFPAAPFYATAHPDYQLPTLANAEKILVTAKSTDTFTIVRAQGPTSAKSIAVGWRISNAVFADDLFNATVVKNETPGGSINSANVTFTIASAFTAGTLEVYLNGQRLKSGSGNDYTESASLRGFVMEYAPDTGDVLTVDYIVGTSVIMNGVNVRIQEAPTGSVNGSNAAFSTSKGYVSGTLQVYVNGLLQAPTTHVTEVSASAGTFTLDVAPQTGDIVRVVYDYAVSAGGNAASVQGYSANDLTPIGVMQPYAGRTAPNSWLLSYGQAISRSTYISLFQVLNPFVGATTMTLATPGVLTLTGHGFATGDAVYLTTTGALPTGLSANTRYFVVRIDANTFSLATTYANAIANTRIATSGSQSGTHSLYATPYGLGDGSTTFNLPDARGRVIAGLDIMGGTSANRLTKPATVGSMNGDVLGNAGGEEAHVQVWNEIAQHAHNVNPDAGSGGAPYNGSTRGPAAGGNWNTGTAGLNYPANVVQPTLIANVIIKAL